MRREAVTIHKMHNMQFVSPKKYYSSMRNITVMCSCLFLMGRHSRGRSPGDLGRAAAGGDAMSSVLALGLSGAGMGLPRRILSSVKDRGAVAGSIRRGSSFPASGVSGGGEDGDGEECVVVGIVVSGDVIQDVLQWTIPQTIPCGPHIRSTRLFFRRTA